VTTNQDKRAFPGRRRFLAAAAATIGLAITADARGYAFFAPDLVGLQVVDRETGQPIHVWRHDGRLFVAGETGDRYSLRVTNHTGGRVLVVLSVDGVNILSGETAGYDQRGYVFDPYESYDVTGWRKSNSEVAAFSFAPLPLSYAARTGRPGNVGVIGMAVFRERVPAPPPQPEVLDRDEARREPAGGADAPATRAAPAPPPPAVRQGQPAPASRDALAGRSVSENIPQRPDERLGTAHGAREWSVVSATTFERSTRYPILIRQIEYDTLANLVACGVIPRPIPEGRPPRPFPRSGYGAGYVPDPPPDP
jgi:hypothetical protein